MKTKYHRALGSLMTAGLISTSTALADDHKDHQDLSLTRFGVEKVDGLDIFYREAGDPKKPAIVLLHGFPSSSHQYRNLITELADDFYCISPDYPGFGDSSAPSNKEFSYTFDNLANIVDKFLDQKDLKKYSFMIQDFGAPVGFRIATKHPERVQSFIVQNGNAYVEGLGEKAWSDIREFWNDNSTKNKKALEGAFSLEGLRWQYTNGTRNPDSINPDNWNLDFMKMARPGVKDAMFDLFYDYQKNLKLYPDWQSYLKKHQPPVLVVWGKNDVFFPVSGAEGYRRDVKDTEYYILDTGHFALEEELAFISTKARAFLKRVNQ